jgi:Trp operon repressor
MFPETQKAAVLAVARKAVAPQAAQELWVRVITAQLAVVLGSRLAVVEQVAQDKSTQAKVEQEFKTQSLELHTSGQVAEQALDILHALVTAEEAEAAVVLHE